MINLNDQDLVIASHNSGKVREISELLKPYAARFYSAADLNLEEPEETATSALSKVPSLTLKVKLSDPEKPALGT